MRRSTSRLLLLCLLVQGVGCSEPAPPGVAAPIPYDTNPNKGDTGVPSDTPDATTSEDGFVTPDASEPGEFGWPCVVNSDCNSGWCVPTATGSVCSDFCITGCPADGWACKLVVVNTDTSYICLPLFMHLCDPCDPSDPLACAVGVGDIGDLCLPDPAGTEHGFFCGGDCSEEVACPEGYTCTEIEYPLGSGSKRRQCLPDADECTCSSTAVQQQASTICLFSNEYGECEGSRECTVEGLSECSALPPAPEVCNGIDDDCDGVVDDADAEDCTSYYKDVDTDGYGTTEESQCLCGPEGLYTAVSDGDCEPELDSVNPGEEEQCGDGVDNDCDGSVDEEGANGCIVYYKDEDKDSWGDELESKCLCAAGAIFDSLIPGDCDDTDPDVKLGVLEKCNGKDDNCDGDIDGDSIDCVNYFLDSDEDGYGLSVDKKCLCGPDAPHTTTESGDCDDTNPSIAPDKAEVCGDGEDNDCNGVIDDGAAEGCDIYFKDSDLDGFGDSDNESCLCKPSGVFTTPVGGDCNDFNGSISPAADEKCGDGLDNDCNGAIEEPNATGCQTFYQDLDKDSYGDATQFQCLCAPAIPHTAEVPGDCDDGDPAVYPGGTEKCNGKDDNCAGGVDEANAVGCTTLYKDSDKDQFGSSEQMCLCAAEGDFTATVPGDCDNGNPNVGPQAVESCDNIDNNCDGSTDEPGALNCVLYYQDSDKDTYGVTTNSQCLCAATGSFTAVAGGDCKDTNDNVFPGQEESCNGVDDDCNDVVDDEGATGCSLLYFDSDGDQYGEPNQTKCLCAANGKWSATQGGDCDDTDLLVFAGTECEGVQCEGYLLTQPKMCSGEGLCDGGGDVAPCPGGFICENDVQCKTACVIDADCVPGNYCIAGLCSGKKINGTPCVDAAECISAHCQNGYCCDSGDCCGGSNTHCDDNNACTDDSCAVSFQCLTVANDVLCAPSTCDGNVFTAASYCANSACIVGGAKSQCAGVNPCKVYGCALTGCTATDALAGAVCGAPVCSGSSISGAPVCDATGGCGGVQPNMPCPGGFVCATESACGTSCVDDGQCASTHYCDSGACLPKGASGTVCDAANECLSDHCENGFCCAAGECCGGKATDCDDGNECTTDVCGPSYVCAHPFNMAQCESSECQPDNVFVTAKYCNQGACSVGGGAQACETDNVCTIDTCSQTGCLSSPVPVGSPCADAVCFGSTVQSPKICDGAGGCSLGGGSALCPGGFVCLDATQCRTSCSIDDHCQTGMYCSNGYCTPKRSDGESCVSGPQCLSGHCGSGFCCAAGACCGGNDNDCDDGELCTTNTCSNTFQCSMVFNSKQCAPGTCNGTTHVAPKFCLAGACQNGGTEKVCEGTNPCIVKGCSPSGCVSEFAPEGTLCASPVCSAGGILTASKGCNGLGLCTLGGAAQNCPGGYVCADASSCGTTCQDSGDCQFGYYCNDLQACSSKRDNGDSCVSNMQCLSDHCENGFCCTAGECCGGKVSDCDDLNACTTDACTGSFKCTHTFNNQLCMPASCDGLSYTAATYCNLGACVDGGGTMSCSGADACKTYSCAADGCQVGNAATGTQCASPSCAGHIITAPMTCDGSGLCNQGGTAVVCPGGLKCQDETSCRSLCTDDSHCAPGYYCGGEACQPKRENGEPCQIAKQCGSNYCANNFCCDGPSGSCCAAALDCNDNNGCTNDGCVNNKCQFPSNNAVCETAVCDGSVHTATKYCSGGVCTQGGQSTSCTGTNPCKTYTCALSGCQSSDVGAGIQCASPGCSGYTLTQALTCDGSGGCQMGGGAAPCAGGLICANGQSCRSSCDVDTHCQPNHYCAGGACIPKRVDGEPCLNGYTCESGYCANGYCCQNDGSDPLCCGGSPVHCDDDNECTEDACVTGFVCATNTNTGSICEPAHCEGNTFVTIKVCSGGSCSLGGTTQYCTTSDPCKINTCTNSGCQQGFQPAGTPCEASSCTGYLMSGNKSCDGGGNCSASGNTAPCPGGFICADAVQCKTACAGPQDCQPNLYCATTACLPLKADGLACSAANECGSGHCSNGFCCDVGDCCANHSDCDDDNVCTDDTCSANNQCQTSNNSATCGGDGCNGTVWTDAKVCQGGACVLGGGSVECVGPNPCNEYQCTPQGCASWPAASGVQCMPPGCSGSKLTQARTCDGSGICSQGGTTADCPGALRCLNADQCRTECSADGHCVNGYTCENAACVPKKADGVSCTVGTECLSNYCNNGLCCVNGTCCTQDVECADGNVCSTNACSDHHCVNTNNSLWCLAAACNGSVHTASKQCAEGQCQLGGAVEDCDKGEICHVYSCTTSGCQDTAAVYGTVCDEPTCLGNTLSQSKVCDGIGGCSAGGETGPCPGNFLCKDQTACWTSCVTDAHCVTGHYCSGGVCMAKKADGSPCVNAVECSSAYCSDGLCCASGECCATLSDCFDDNVCTSDYCQNNVCLHVNNEITCASGACAGTVFTSAKTCQGGSCALGGQAQNCSGNDPCKTYSCTSAGCLQDNQSAGTLCAASVCLGSTWTTPKQCNAQGACAEGGVSAPCAGHFRCKNSVECNTVCLSDAECVDGYFCSGGACIPQLADGQPCVSNNECGSNYCNNFICCAGGDCCISTGGCNDGNTCTTDSCVNAMCEHNNNTAMCEASTCNGLLHNPAKFCQAGSCNNTSPSQDCSSNTTTCMNATCSNINGCGLTPKPSGTVCNASLCVATQFHPASLCDAAGTCVPSPIQECDDGNTCTGDETCNSTQGCLSGTPTFQCGDAICSPTCETATDCTSDCSCTVGADLRIGEVDSWSTTAAGSANQLQAYTGCGVSGLVGDEYTYRLTAPLTGTLKASLRGADPYTHLLVLKSSNGNCDPAACFAQATGTGSSVTFAVTAGEEVRLVVDRALVGGVNYELYVRYADGQCHMPFIEDWQRTPFPRAWSVEPNWQMGIGSPFGATHARFTGAPTQSNFSKSLLSPVFDTTGCSSLQLSFQWRYLQLIPHDGVSLFTEVSTNGGTTWSTVFEYASSQGDKPETTTAINVLGLAGSASARVRFRVAGDTTQAINQFQVDDVNVTP